MIRVDQILEDSRMCMCGACGTYFDSRAGHKCTYVSPQQLRRREMFEKVALALLSNYPGISDSDELLRKTGDITNAILKAADEFAKEGE